MERKQSDRISGLFHAALARPAGERNGFLSSACEGDDELRHEVESLLGFEAAASGFLEQPAGWAASDMRGRKLGPYTILAPIGVGGMGEVYRARDLKLERDVAIKVLPMRFTADPERRTRFAREARLLATLNHPHIGAIYGLEESEGVTALILELVDGPTLADRLRQGALPVDDALTIARQVARALGAAHAKGIIHRDLKPANVVLEGTVAGNRESDLRAKVLDFGVAKTIDGTDPTSIAEPSGTRSTADGRILGTPAYMSPEQARGLRVDQRTDIWSFGCLLFEMLSGMRPFDGATPADTVAAILEREPDWSAIPAATPEHVRHLLRRCLEKEPSQRLGDIGDVRLELEGASQRSAVDESRKAERWWHGRGRLVGVAAAVLAVAGLLWVSFGRRPSEPPLRVTRLTFEPGLQTHPALSPDGRLIAYAGNREGNFDLYTQAVDGGNPVRVTRHPAHDWQPDWSVNAEIVFRSEREEAGLYVVSPTGGHERRVAAFGEWPVWSPNGTRILFRHGPSLMLYSVGLDGAPPRTCTECFGGAYGWYGESHIATLATGPGPEHLPQLRVIDLERSAVATWTTSPSVAKAFQDLGVSVGRTVLAWEPDGQRLYFSASSGGTSAIWRLDVDRVRNRLTGGPHRVATMTEAGSSVSVARASGAIAFAAASWIPRISWFPLDQEGHRVTGASEPLSSRELPPSDADVTPDGSRLIFSVTRPGGTTIELRTRRRDTPAERPLLVTDGTRGERRQRPVLSPDGTRVVYRYVHPELQGPSGTHNLLLPQQLRVLTIETGQEAELTETAPRLVMPGGFSRDGRFVVASVDLRSKPGHRSMSIGLFPVAAAPRADAQMKVVTTHDGDNGLLQPAMSPDGRWIAFEVQGHTARIAFVGSTDGLWNEPQNEGQWRYLDPLAMYAPRWSADGRQLYFVSTRGGLQNVWGVDFDPGSGSVGRPFQVTAFDGRDEQIQLSTSMFAAAQGGLTIRTHHPTGGIWLAQPPGDALPR